MNKHSFNDLNKYLIAFVCLLGFSTHAPGTSIVETLQDEDVPVNSAEGKRYRVKVDTVQPFRTSAGQLLFRLNYNYQFKDHQFIHLKGVGRMPASGKQEHFFEKEYLEFEDLSGNLLVKIKLKPNKKAPEAGALDLPQESEFVNFLSDTGQDPTAFLPKALQKLNNWFPPGYTIRQDGQVTSFVTAYRDVDGIPSHLRGQIAIKLSYPFDRNNNQFFFRVYIVKRQKPKKSSGPWESSNERAFEDFVARLLKDLKS